MARQHRPDLAHRAFVATLLLKLILGAVQLASGALLAATPPDTLTGLIHALIRLELAEDPDDPLAGLLQSLLPAARSERQFYILYLLLHGALNAGVAVALALGHRLAYASSIAVLVAFVFYQLWKYMMTPSILLLILTAIDLVVIALSVIEMRSGRLARTTRPEQ